MSVTLRPRPGDAILVSRRITARAWLHDPINTFIAWRIQRATRSKWNHAAGYLGHGMIAEAELDLGGVKLTGLVMRYPLDRYEVAVAPFPSAVDADHATSFWRIAASVNKGSTYDVGLVLRMAWTALRHGHDGIRKLVKIDTRDTQWICSELVAAGWESAGDRGCGALKTPADIAAYAGVVG